MSLGRGILVVGVGILLAVALVWLTLPTIGVVGVVFTQVPVLDHVMTEMGFDDRIRQAMTYVLLGVMVLTANHCLSRKKHIFYHLAIVAFGTMASAYLAWYVNDRWLAGVKPVDIGDPAFQAQAFDPYSGKPNFCATNGLAGGEHIYWKYVKYDPFTGLHTHLLESGEYQKLLNQRCNDGKQSDDPQRQEPDKERQTQASLTPQVQKTLGFKVMTN